MLKYDSYKDSGVEWIGEIPSHWEKTKIKWELEFHNNKRIPIEGEKREQMSGEYRYYGASGIIDYVNDYIFDGKYILVGEDGANILTRNTPLAFNVEGKFWVNNHAHILKNKRGSISYFTYQIEMNDFSVISTGSAQPKLTKEALGDLILFVPPVSEQQIIVEFLDKKTTLIDTLIQKTEEKINLLREKRTSLINHAVTKGLNPEVEMKNSGVEWIGEIPNHWIFIPMKFLFKSGKDSIKTGPFGSQLKSEDFVSDGIKVYNQRTVYDENFDQNELYIDSVKYDQLKGFEVFPGEILITSRGTIGRSTIVPDKIQKGILHPCLIRIRTEKSIIFPVYLKKYINDTTLFLETVKLESNSTTIDVIYSDTLKNLRLPIPPLSEQHQIVQYLDTQTQRIDTLIQKEEQRVELLKEYRQTLISDVVTGKIKVTTHE